MLNKLKDKKILSLIIALVVLILVIIIFRNNKTSNEHGANKDNHEENQIEIIDDSEIPYSTEVILGEDSTEILKVDENTTWSKTEELQESLEATAKRFYEYDKELLQPYIDKGLTEDIYIFI